jgi:single-stranded DNA-binding protein
MNSVKMTGHLASEPRLAPTDAGRPVCDMRVTVDNGRYRSFEIDVSVFDAPAETCADELSKDDEVRISGELRFRRWRDRAGWWHEGFSIAGSVEPLAGVPGPDAGPPDGPEPVGAAVADPALVRDPAEAGAGPASVQQLGIAARRYGDPHD